MDEDTIVLAEITLRLVFDEEHGELLQVLTAEDHQPTQVQMLGMLELAKFAEVEGEDDE